MILRQMRMIQITHPLRWPQLLVGPALAASVMVWVAVAGLGALAASQRGPSNTKVLPDPCTFATTRDVVPLVVHDAVEDITLSLGLDVSCVAVTSTRPLNIVLIIDRAADMQPEQWDNLRLSLLEGIGELDMRNLPYLRIGVVSTITDGQVESYLTQTPEQVAAAINNVPQDVGPSCLDCAFDKALKELELAPPSPDIPPRQVIFLMSGSNVPLACDSLRQKANEIKSRRNTVLVTMWACAGPSCERPCLSTIASDQSLAFANWSWNALREAVSPLYQLVHAQGLFHPVKGADLADDLEYTLSYNSGGQPSRVIGQRRLEWDIRQNYWPADGLHFTYAAKSLVCSDGYVNKVIDGMVAVSATVHYDPIFWPDVADHSLTFRNLRFRCIEQTATPDAPATPTALTAPTRVTPAPGIGTATPTPESPGSPSGTVTPGSTGTTTVPSTLTVTSTPTASPSRTPGPGAGSTPTAPPAVSRPGRAFLPIVNRYSCLSLVHSPLDVVIAIDVSGSMAVADIPPFRNRWEAARAVALSIVAEADAGDQLAVLAFFGRRTNDDPRPFTWLSTLDADKDTALVALAGLPQRGGSELAPALAGAAEELAGPRARAMAQKVLIVMSDGVLLDDSRRLVATQAAAARERGIRIVAVGMGADADLDYLAEVTGSPGRVYLTENLAGAGLIAHLATLPHCLP